MASKVLRNSGRQYAVLPLIRHQGEVCTMLLTSRDTGRWVLPKGWAEKGLTGPEVAAKEAFEEAGLVGQVQRASAGHYSYLKAMPKSRAVACQVEVFPLWVEHVLDDWPERMERSRAWFPLREAATLVQEDSLRCLLEGLAAGVEFVDENGGGAWVRLREAEA